jgi:hypothetical protein
MADPAAIVPLVHDGPPVPPNQTTYLQFYQDDSHDNAAGNYAAIMSTFAVPVAGDAPAPALVTESVYASAVADPQAFVTLVVDNVTPEGRVCMFHRLQRFAPQLGVMTGLDKVMLSLGMSWKGNFPPRSNGPRMHSTKRVASRFAFRPRKSSIKCWERIPESVC